MRGLDGLITVAALLIGSAAVALYPYRYFIAMGIIFLIVI